MKKKISDREKRADNARFGFSLDVERVRHYHKIGAIVKRDYYAGRVATQMNCWRTALHDPGQTQQAFTKDMVVDRVCRFFGGGSLVLDFVDHIKIKTSTVATKND